MGVAVLNNAAAYEVVSVENYHSIRGESSRCDESEANLCPLVPYECLPACVRSYFTYWWGEIDLDESYLGWQRETRSDMPDHYDNKVLGSLAQNRQQGSLEQRLDLLVGL